MCLRLLYNALGWFYMCWAHFICSYISEEEFSVRLMGERLQGLSHLSRQMSLWKQAKAPDNKHFSAISHSSSPPTQHIYYSVNPHHLFSLTAIDWPASCRQGLDIIFPPRDMASGSIFSLLVKLFQPLAYQLGSIIPHIKVHFFKHIFSPLLGI